MKAPWGLSPRQIGGLTAVLSLIADQANKLWLIYGFDIASRQPVPLTPFFDVVYARNPGISYSLLSASTEFGRWALFAGTFAATLFIGVWMWRATSRLVAFGLGLIVGGALGNGSDRLFFGTVADFYHFHVGSFSWYIFNLADCAIVAGVALLIYDSLFSKSETDPSNTGKLSSEEGSATKSPRSEA